MRTLLSFLGMFTVGVARSDRSTLVIMSFLSKRSDSVVMAYGAGLVFLNTGLTSGFKCMVALNSLVTLYPSSRLLGVAG